jgi:BirA family transcriptional regulator, biotin operon repressor / biotin---[acetyl-CoA-carboxylase] ligase
MRADEGTVSPGPWSGRSQEEWARALGVPLLELHPVIPSTNAHLRRLASEGAPPFATVVARAQTAGRGREGRAWHSPSDTGLWFSVLLPLGPEGEALPRPLGIGVLPLAVGIAVAIAVERLSGVRASLKWPNDVLVGERKVAGVLCESAGASGAMAAVGIGVNLRVPAAGVPAEISSTAGFLEQLCGRDVMEPELARIVIEELRRWAHPVPGALSGRLQEEWMSRDFLAGRQVGLESGDTGVARGVSSDGTLRVALKGGGTASVRAGGVRLVEAAESR